MDATVVAVMLPPPVTAVMTRTVLVTGRALLSNGEALSPALLAASEEREVLQETCSEARTSAARTLGLVSRE